MATLSSWYNSQYGTWNRTRNLSMAPYLARTDTNTSRTAAAMAQQRNEGAVVIDMGDLNETGTTGRKKKVDTLFGPNIGVVASGPAWTEADEKDEKGAVDELTPEVVKSWIAKSKESSQPTTTLQALVNLKRPTLRLSPLAADADDAAPAHDHHEHGLEFEYDCDAPRCAITVSVLLPPAHPDVPADARAAAGGAGEGAGRLARVCVFEHVVAGGFARHLTLEEGAMLELGRYDPLNPLNPLTGPASSTAALAAGAPAIEPRPADRKSRRFTNFHFRRRGPALAVVDAPAPTAAHPATASSPNLADTAGGAKADADAGVKVHIRLAALDAAGEPLAARNEQGTYLHVVRMRAPGASEEARDAKPWVVTVVKREATIGPHTFQLHEIYGLSAQSAPAPAPADVPTDTGAGGDAGGDAHAHTHTYPPASAPVVRDDEPQSECLLCLSAPREVVLLPCRHLVACRECALNMVEFGAGGAIVQPEADAAGPGADARAQDEGAPGEGGGGGGGGGAGGEGMGVRSTLVAHLVGGAGAATGTPVNPGPGPGVGAQGRRKRKAKGWFCPVCRQPYTSLLRITTIPPSAPEKEGGNRASTSTDGDGDGGDGGGDGLADVSAPRGLAALRPAFLRGISRPSAGEAERGEAAV